MTTQAKGTFDIQLTPQAPDDPAADPSLGRMTIDKQFHGDLEATSQGAMLTAGTAIPGSAGYVAIEWVSGTLQGRRGAFVLQHSATLTRGTPDLRIAVVPDSGTAELQGLVGTMAIDVADGQHTYDFAYTLADPR